MSKSGLNPEELAKGHNRNISVTSLIAMLQEHGITKVRAGQNGAHYNIHTHPQFTTIKGVNISTLDQCEVPNRVREAAQACLKVRQLEAEAAKANEVEVLTWLKLPGGYHFDAKDRKVLKIWREDSPECQLHFGLSGTNLTIYPTGFDARFKSFHENEVENYMQAVEKLQKEYAVTLTRADNELVIEHPVSDFEPLRQPFNDSETLLKFLAFVTTQLDAIWEAQRHKFTQDLGTKYGFELQEGEHEQKPESNIVPKGRFIIISHPKHNNGKPIATVPALGNLHFISAASMNEIVQSTRPVIVWLDRQKAAEDLRQKKENITDLLHPEKPKPAAGGTAPVTNHSNVTPISAKPPAASPVAAVNPVASAPKPAEIPAAAENAPTRSVTPPAVDAPRSTFPTNGTRAAPVALPSSRPTITPITSMNSPSEKEIDIFTFGYLVATRRRMLGMTQAQLAERVTDYIIRNTPAPVKPDLNEDTVKDWELSKALPKPDEYKALETLLIERNPKIRLSEKAAKKQEFREMYDGLCKLFHKNMRMPSRAEMAEFQGFIADRRNEMDMLDGRTIFTRKLIDELTVKNIPVKVDEECVIEIEGTRHLNEKPSNIVYDAIIHSLSLDAELQPCAKKAWELVPQQPRKFMDDLLKSGAKKPAEGSMEALKEKLYGLREKLQSYFVDEKGEILKQSKICEITTLNSSVASYTLGNGDKTIEISANTADKLLLGLTASRPDFSNEMEAEYRAIIDEHNRISGKINEMKAKAQPVAVGV